MEISGIDLLQAKNIPVCKEDLMVPCISHGSLQHFMTPCCKSIAKKIHSDRPAWERGSHNPAQSFINITLFFYLLILNLKQKENYLVPEEHMIEWHFWNEPSEKLISRAEAWIIKLVQFYYIFLYHHFQCKPNGNEIRFDLYLIFSCK